MTDAQFDRYLPDELKDKSKQHFTPKSVIKKACDFLCSEDHVTIADIGSGVGKFCLLGALEFPHGNFYGIEVRADLFELACNIKKELQLPNVEFILGDIKDIPLHRFQHFYLFNPFHENIESEHAIDNALDLNEKKYLAYSGYIYRQLKRMPAGTRIASFHMPEASFPETYMVVDAHFDHHLLFLEKIQ